MTVHRAAALVAWLAAGLWVSTISRAEEPARPIDAKEFRSILEKERGKVVVVNLWATWCVPCLREIPDLVSVTREVQKQGVTLIGVAVDDPSPGALQVESFRKRYFPDFRPEDFADLPVWRGLRPCSPDGLPYLGRFGRYANLTAATGHAMMGLSLAPITGQLVAQVVSGEPPALPLALLHPDRYP
jgi:glycine/D-amino acid oxidase-like deaminating enzyme